MSDLVLTCNLKVNFFLSLALALNVTNFHPILEPDSLTLNLGLILNGILGLIDFHFLSDTEHY